jgi:hypothetical protein
VPHRVVEQQPIAFAVTAHETDPGADRLTQRPRRWLPGDRDRPLGRRGTPGDHLERGKVSGAGQPGNTDDLALVTDGS